MANPKIRNMLLQSQPEVYGIEANGTAKQALVETAQDTPHDVLEVLLEDLIWRTVLESFVADEDTPALAQIVELALQGDFELAHERTQLAYNLEKDRSVLLSYLRVAAHQRLTQGE